MPRTVRGVIFDLDGVITDTAESHYLAWQRMADEEGLPFDREAGDALRGVSRRPAVEQIIGDRPYTEDEIVELMDRKNAYYVEMLEDIKASDVLPGARELIDEMRAAGLKVALGSASKNARPVLGFLGIADRFDAISDGNSVEAHKPEPDLFLHAAGQLGISAEEGIVVEDAEAGVQAGLAGGFLVVGLGPADRVGAAHLVLPDLTGVTLAQLLTGLDAQLP
jgi:kojibiose phosphorylase